MFDVKNDVLSEESRQKPVEKQTMFCVVSIPKFVILFLCIGSPYILYWFYRNWTAYRNATKADILPGWRAFFSLFFIFSLFAKIQSRLEAQGHTYQWFPNACAVGIWVVNLLLIGLSRLSFHDISAENFLLLNHLFFAIGIWLFVGAQRAINLAEGDAEGKSNAEFTPENCLWMCAGLGVTVFLAVSLLNPTGY